MRNRIFINILLIFSIFIFLGTVSAVDQNTSSTVVKSSSISSNDDFPVGGIAMFTGKVPYGWTVVNELNGVFPRGSSTPGGTGGSATHSHTYSCTTGYDGYFSTPSGGGSSPSGWTVHHTHTISGTTSVSSNIPPYYNVIFARKGPNAASGFPVGGIAIFTGKIPSGWTRVTELDGLFPRGSSTSGGTGGSATHIHTYSGTTTTEGWIGLPSDGGSVSGSWQLHHTHSYSGTTSVSSNIAPYLNVIFARKGSNAAAGFPAGGIAIFTSNLPSNWTYFKALNGRFPRGSATYGGTGGSATHSHTFSGTTDFSGNIGLPSSGSCSTGNSISHKHDYSGTTSETSNLPPYLNVIYAQKQTPFTITTSDPSNGATNVAASKTITVTFNKTIKKGSNFWVELKNSSGTTIAFTSSVSDTVLIIDPKTNLIESLYTLLIHTGAVTDLAGNPAAAKIIKFTVGTPPKVVATSPTNLKTGVTRTGTIMIKFSENIYAGPYYGKIMLKNLITGRATTIIKAIKGNTLYIKNTSTRSAYTWYQMIIPTYSIKDRAGNIITTAYAFKFKTGAK